MGLKRNSPSFQTTVYLISLQCEYHSSYGTYLADSRFHPNVGLHIWGDGLNSSNNPSSQVWQVDG